MSSAWHRPCSEGREKVRSIIMRAALAPTTFLLALLVVAGASAESLRLPDNLVDLRSPQGEAYLLETHALEAYFPISVAFETQKTQSYCGVASMVSVLNAIGAPAPTSPEYQPYTTFTQDNVLNEKTDAIRPRDAILHRGMTLDQLGGMLSLYPVTVEVHHAETGGVDTFRKLASESLASKNRFVIVNFLRKALERRSAATSRRLRLMTKNPTAFSFWT